MLLIVVVNIRPMKLERYLLNKMKTKRKKMRNKKEMMNRCPVEKMKMV